MKLKVLLILSLFLIIISCNSPQKLPEKLEKISIGIQNNTASSLIHIAHEKDYFRQNGLEVEIKPYPSGKLAFGGMLAGNCDFASVADIPITINAIKQKKFKIVSTIAESDQGAWIVADRRQGINTQTDLKSKKIATQVNSAVHYFLHLFLLKHDLHDDFIPVLMPAVELPQALQDKKIAAFSMRNPFIQQAKDELGVNAVEFKEPGLYVQSFNLVAGDSILSAKPEIAGELVKSLLQALELTLQDEQQAQQAVIAQLGKDRTEEVLADWDNYDFQVSLKQYLIILLEDETVFASHRGLVEPGIMPNFLDFIYLDALLQNDESKVSIIR